jgi:DNA-binding LacI/PurR family transcriptional regulator
MSRLQRATLAERLAETLTDEILAGVWSEHLPGYRTLARRYEVSRPTCEAALILLEKAGLLAPPEAGRMRRISAAASGSVPARKRNLLVITDRTIDMASDDEELIRQCTDYWRSEGGQVHEVSGDLRRNRRPASLLGRWIKQTGADCMLFFVPPAPWVEAAELSGVPCYALGGDTVNSIGVISQNGWAYIDFLERRVKSAAELGHQRILAVLGSVITPERIRDRATARLSALQQELEAAGWPPVSITIEGPGLPDPDGWHRWWPKVLGGVRPTLVILERIPEAVSLHSHCLRNGVRLPQDLSMLGMGYDSTIGWLNPPPTCYAYPSDKALAHFRRWVRKGFPPGDRVLLEEEYMGGKTLGPAPSR